MGDVLRLDETKFDNGRLIFEYEDNAKIRGFHPANVLRVMFLHPSGDGLIEEIGEQIFPASDFPAALKNYRDRIASKRPERRIGGYWHVSTWLSPDMVNA